MQKELVLTLADKLRANEIVRWHMLGGKQTVAQHSFNVAILARVIAAHLFNPPESVLCAVVNAAIHHDLAETITGDIPSHFKRLNPEIKAAAEELEAKIDDGYVPIADKDKRRVVDISVRIADLWDGIRYAECRYLTSNSGYAKSAFDGLHDALRSYCDSVDVDCDCVIDFFTQQLRPSKQQCWGG
jgi:hypothetical protein